MNTDMIIVLVVILLAVFLFATEKIRVDLTALLVMAILLLSGIITPEEGVSGFSNTATVTVAAMFVISAGLRNTGAVNYLGKLCAQAFAYSYSAGIIGTMLAVGITSAFINNTPVVAIFIPILLTVSARQSISASRLLMPISFASMFGGVCTLVGTSTNILVSSIAQQHGMPGFGMFEFTPLGLLFFAAGVIYMMLIGIRMIPDRGRESDLTERYEMDHYLTDVVLLPEAKSVGMRLPESPLVQELELDILEVLRDGKRLLRPLPNIILQANDHLRVRGNVKQIRELQDRAGIAMKGDSYLKDADFAKEELQLVEAVIAPNAPIIGKSIKSSDFRNAFSANALALRHKGRLLREAFAKTKLQAGDALLIEVRKENFLRLRNDRNFVIVSEVDTPRFRTSRIVPALLIAVAIIVTATFEILPIMISAIVGAVLLVLTRCLTLAEAYDSIDWKVVFLLGGILSLGIALEKTGAARLVSDGIVAGLGDVGPIAVVAALYLLTSLLTETMSNNATAVLLAPIAIAAAATMGVSPKPFLMAVTFAASASFMTPVGYQTNTMIYGVGKYRFIDFVKVGTPLNLIFWIIATLMIPVLFPF
jgi:di/tricarboxylate transporter